MKAMFHVTKSDSRLEISDQSAVNSSSNAPLYPLCQNGNQLCLIPSNIPATVRKVPTIQYTLIKLFVVP